MARVLITGFQGFIGSNLVRYWLDHYPNDEVIGLDCHTYASNPKYLNGVADRIKQIDVDIRDDMEVLLNLDTDVDAVFHLAAESHVCTSIQYPKLFMETNAMGTFNLLSALKESEFRGRFIHVSTDEVFGEAHPGTKFSELTQIKPRSPYAASKAASDHIALSFHHTYGLDVVVTNCSNNFGRNQHKEKLIPKTIHALMNQHPMTVYGSGEHVRDWLHVLDHCKALDTVYRKGRLGDRYCIGGNREMSNLEVIKSVSDIYSEITGKDWPLEIQYTTDRPSDDRRYAIDSSKVEQLGWSPSPYYWLNMKDTIQWYIHEAHDDPRS